MRKAYLPAIIVSHLAFFLFSGCQPTPKSPDALANYNLSLKGKIAPLSSGEIDQAPWGIHFNGMPFHDNTHAQYDSLDVESLLQELPALIQKTGELGVKWARISVDWGLIEDHRGEFHWELLDPMVHGLTDAGIAVYPSLHGGHFIHTGNKPPLTPAEIEAWLNFTSKVVTRYQDQVTYWEIWNEPNTTWFWGQPDAEAYHALVEVTSKQIKEIDPASKVIGGSLARLDVPYADTLFRLGIADHIDVFSFHPYGVFPEAALKKMKVQVRMPLLYEPVMNPVEGLIELIEQSGKNIELWQGECGYPSAMNGGGWNGTGPYSPEVQAKWILRRAFTDLSYDAKVSAYFMLKENKHPYYDFFNYKGLLTFSDLAPKQGYLALQNLCAVMHGDFKRDSELAGEFTIQAEGDLFGIKPKNIHSTGFRNGDAAMLAYWGKTHMQNKVKPGKVDIQLKGVDLNCTFQLYDLLSGNIYDIDTPEYTEGRYKLKGLPLCDFPYLIIAQRR
ncbi:MAG: hypothetical protein KI786_11945 [Mameliella sp.]|nr:hypothetical protein [Phaeodactylibacter sp.]